MNKNRMNLRLFEADANIIDRSGAESLIPTQEANEIIQGTIAQSAVLSRGRKLATQHGSLLTKYLNKMEFLFP